MANSPSREGIYGYVFERAEEEEKLFDIDKFEQYLFRETHTYTPSLFKKEFVLPKEREEGIAVENWLNFMESRILFYRITEEQLWINGQQQSQRV